jgi:hypothetical protein
MIGFEKLKAAFNARASMRQSKKSDSKTSASAYSCCYSAFRDRLTSLLFRQKTEECLGVN